MKALQTYLIVASLLFIGIVGCQKDRRERTCETKVLPCMIDSSQVHVRVRNLTGFPMCDIKLSYNGADTFELGPLQPDDSTCYIAVSKAIDYPGLRFNIGAETITDTLNFFLNTYTSEKTFITYGVSVFEWIDPKKIKVGILESQWYYDINTKVQIYP